MNAGYELSPQQRQVFEQSRENETAGLAILLEGGLDVGELRQVLQVLLNRHEILRTSFQRRTGMKFPFQVVREHDELSWDEIDLSTVPESQQRSSIQELLRDSSNINFEKGPAFHCNSVKLGRDRHLLALTFSVLCVDNVSLNIIFSELRKLYSGQVVSKEVLQYADYSEWQNELFREDGEQAKQAAQFWHRVPIESIPALGLPLERKSPTNPCSWDTVPVALPATFDGLTAVQLEDFLFACWQIFLWRLTSQQEFVIAYLSDGRRHEEFVYGVGAFAKSLPTLVNFEAEQGFTDFLGQSEKGRASTLEWQDYFSANVIANRASVGFAFQQSPEKTTPGGIEISEFARFVPVVGPRLQLRCTVSHESHTAGLDFDTSHFDRRLVTQFANGFSVLCRAASTTPSLPVSALPIISEADRQKVVHDFNQTAAEYPHAKCVHQLFEEQAALHPNRPALRFGENVLSFSKLNQEANRVAHMLRQNGIGANVPVALCLERSAEMIISLLGILKAGGCYVPLIPDNPKSRLAHQLSETGAPVVLTEQKHLDRLPQFGGKIICIDRDRALLSAHPSSNPQVDVSPENLVYVIYTSGSTGTPKGVAVRHFSLVNYGHFIWRRLELEEYPEGLHFATVSTIGADLGNTCIFPALISGGCLHVISYEMAMSPFVFGDYASRHPIDVLKITPSHLSTLLNSDAASSLLPRKYLVLGGEAASWDLVERVRQFGSCTIFNHYGPTEATVGCCTFKVDSAEVSAWEPATVPIGRPIANDQVYILGQRTEPVPVGVAGELCIGGTGLAQGYLNQPQQTAECFLPNPFSNVSAARMYRTGDLARFLPDGNIEFLGRIDQQVKIRGFRVEPAEIETVLKRHPAVEHAAVIPLEGKSGEKRLAAYVVGASRPEELGAFLAQELPDYMVPANIILVDSLPLTPNGKLDLRALPSPDLQTVREMVAPRTPEEEKLTGIWQEVLKLERVGVTDNFFELGGHSLLATQIISRIRNAFRIQISLQVFLQHPTIAALAGQISQCPAIENEQEEMARLLHELEGISDEEAERLLAAELQKDEAGSSS